MTMIGLIWGITHFATIMPFLGLPLSTSIIAAIFSIGTILIIADSILFISMFQGNKSVIKNAIGLLAVGTASYLILAGFIPINWFDPH